MAVVSTIEYGDPATQKALLETLSPIGKLGRIRAATMVLHGANDTNVPVVEAEQIVNQLKSRGVPVDTSFSRTKAMAGGRCRTGFDRSSRWSRSSTNT
jgi:hypothetical protein